MIFRPWYLAWKGIVVEFANLELCNEVMSATETIV